MRFCTTLHAWGTLSDRNGVQGVAGSNPAVPIGSKFQSLKDFGRIAPTAGERKGWLQSMRGACRRRSAWPPTWCGAEMANSTPDAPNVGAAVHRKLRALVVLNGGNAKLNRIRLVGPTTDGDGEP